MLNQMVALGLRSWHAFWTPVKAWAEHHQNHNGDALQFFASLATVVGLPILTLLILATLAFLIADRMVLIDKGHIVATGAREEIQASSHPRVRQFLDRVPEEEKGAAEDYLALLTETKSR